MHLFRLIAGFLTLSLTFGVALGDFFHVQGENSDVQVSDHLIARADTIDVNNAADTLSSGTDGESCYETSPQVAITTPSGHQNSTTDAIGVTSNLITKIAYYQTEIPLTFKGRDAPLFEHASLFAATVSMRV